MSIVMCSRVAQRSLLLSKGIATLKRFCKGLVSISTVSLIRTTTREEWRPAGGQPVGETLKYLENVCTTILREDGVPELLKDKEVTINSGLSGLWEVLDMDAEKEINRLVSLDFFWIFVDPLSLYHSKIQKVANRIGGCVDRNKWLNLFILDPIERTHDRSNLRSKLEADFASLYVPLVKPNLRASRKCLGGVDVWHPDDFERVFRETLRLRDDVHPFVRVSQSQERRLTTFGAGG